MKYINSDNANAIVIKDKEEYDEAVMDKLNNGNFHELWNDPSQSR